MKTSPVDYKIISDQDLAYIQESLSRGDVKNGVVYARELAQNNVPFFNWFFLKYDITPHMVYAIDQTNTYNKAIIRLPRSHGKSLQFIGEITHDLAYSLVPNTGYQDPRIMIVQETATVVADTIQAVRNIFETGGPSSFMRLAFGDPRTKATKWSEDKIWFGSETVSKDPSLIGIGVKGAITGKHPKKLIFDDVVSVENSKTAYLRDQMWFWYRNCVTGDTKVLTENRGYVAFTDLKSTDVVIWGNSKGKTPYISFVDSGEDDVYRLTTVSGKSIRANANHKFLVRAPNKKPFWTRLYQIKSGMQIATPKKAAGFSDRGTYNQGLILGYMLGDGCFTADSPIFCGFEKTINKFSTLFNEFDCDIRTRKKEDSGLIYVQICRRGLGPGNGYIKNKFVQYLEFEGLRNTTGSNKYLRYEYSKDFYRGLVEGLIETDGSIRVHHDKGNISFSNISELLCRQLQDILQRFGIQSRIYVRENGRFDEKSNKSAPLWTVMISDSQSVMDFKNTFSLLEKQESLDKLSDLFSRKKSRKQSIFYDSSYVFERIVSIEYIGKENVYCISMPPESDHSFIANGLVSGNTIEGIIDPSTKVRVLCTPYYEGDLNNRLELTKTFKIVNLPALSRMPSQQDFEPVWDITGEQIIGVKVLPPGMDITSLWPCPLGTGKCPNTKEHYEEYGEHRSVEFLLLKYATDPYGFRGQYMLSLVSTELAPIKKEHLRFYSTDPTLIGKPNPYNESLVVPFPGQNDVIAGVHGWDHAIGKKRRANKTCLARGYRTKNNDVYLSFKYGHWDFPTVVDMMESQYITDPVRRPFVVVTEGINFAEAYSQQLNKQSKGIIPVEVLKDQSDKSTALVESGLLNHLISGRVYFDVTDSEAIAEFLTFTGEDGKSDDIVDAGRIAFTKLKQSVKKKVRLYSSVDSDIPWNRRRLGE